MQQVIMHFIICDLSAGILHLQIWGWRGSGWCRKPRCNRSDCPPETERCYRRGRAAPPWSQERATRWRYRLVLETWFSSETLSSAELKGKEAD